MCFAAGAVIIRRVILAISSQCSESQQSCWNLGSVVQDQALGEKAGVQRWARSAVHPDWWLILIMLVAQSCPTFCDPMDCIPPGSTVHGILQARTLEWFAISFSRGSSQPVSPVLAGGFFTTEPLGKPRIVGLKCTWFNKSITFY